MPGVMHVPSMFGPTNKFNSIQLEVEQFRAPSIDNFLPFRGTILIGQLLKASWLVPLFLENLTIMWHFEVELSGTRRI